MDYFICWKGPRVSTKSESLSIACIHGENCPLYAIQGLLYMYWSEWKDSRDVFSELSVISLVSAVEGCPLSGVPLYLCITLEVFVYYGLTSYVLLISIHVLLELALLEVGIGLGVGSTISNALKQTSQLASLLSATSLYAWNFVGCGCCWFTVEKK